jgi:hypothetical protein
LSVCWVDVFLFSGEICATELLRPRKDFEFEDNDALRLNVPGLDSLGCEPFGDPPLVLGLVVAAGVLLEPNIFPPLNNPPPCEEDGVDRCISAASAGA